MIKLTGEKMQMSLAFVSLRYISTNVEVTSALRSVDLIGHGSGLMDSGRTRLIKAQKRRRERWNCLSLSTDLKSFRFLLDGSGEESGRGLLMVSSLVGDDAGETATSPRRKVNEMVSKQAALLKKQEKTGGDGDNRQPEIVLIPGRSSLLNEAYDRCREVCSYYSKTFYLGTLLMTPERRKAIWAIYVWCRRTDELVDGPNALHVTPSILDYWESRLENIFRGEPFDILDTALSDTFAKFPIDIQPFRDMIKGMRMDLTKTRYKSFDELYLYSYYVAGTVGLMIVPVIGIAWECRQASPENVCKTALALGVANQLTNILRDVGEDARRGRIYLPQDELAQAGLSDEDIFAGKVTRKWRLFMKNQIKRARMFFDEAESGVVGFSKPSRWPVWASLLLYRQILDEIEANDYDNFTKKVFVGKEKKMLTLPIAYARSIIGTSRTYKA